MSGFLQNSIYSALQDTNQSLDQSGMASAGGCISILIWPFLLLGRLVATLVRLTGRAICAFLGFTFMVVGVVLTLTVIGAVIGIPLVLFGLMLVVRSLF